MNRAPFLISIQGRILSIVAIAALGFTLYIAFNFIEARRQAEHLEKIQSQEFPIQLELQQAVFALKQTHTYLEEAVITAELSAIGRAEYFADQFRKSIVQATEIKRGDALALATLLEKFEKYYENSVFLANQLIGQNSSLETLFQLGRDNTEDYQQIVTQLENRFAKETENFINRVNNVSTTAQTNVKLGAFTGTVTVLILICVAWLLLQRVVKRVDYMVQSLKSIAENKSDLSTRLPVDNSDEMSVLAHWFNAFLEKLERITNESAEQMALLANTDSLTNLPNRRLFNQMLGREIERADRDGNHNPVVLFIDLDNFKPINDELGHDKGDLVLKVVAERLQRAVQNHAELYSNSDTDINVDINSDTDSPSSQQVVARLGGDEFILLTTTPASEDALTNFADTILNSVSDPVVTEGQSLKVGVSIGIARYPQDGKTANELLAHADMAMYEAKNRGKNSFCFYGMDVAESADRSIKQEGALREAIKNDELELYAQPIVDLKTQRISSAELLLRWNSAEWGSVSPAEFIATAEKSDLIFELDEWVLRNACEIIRRLIKAGIDDVPLSINISAKQASRTSLVSKVVAALYRNNIPQNLLTLEITETTALANIEVVADNIRKLKSLSVPVAIDDFGAGHSSLMLLKHCEIDVLKIDREFVSSLGSNHSVDTIVETVISLASKLDVTIVAEGIETPRQQTLLRGMGCQLGQGFYMYRPMPINDFIAMLENKDGNHHDQIVHL